MSSPSSPDAHASPNAVQLNFVTAVQQELAKGYGFVPLIGTGLSAPSGIPIVAKLKSYLERCLALALGLEQPGMRRWRPRHDQWPPLTHQCPERQTPQRSPRPGSYENIYGCYMDRQKQDPLDPELPVFQEALGALADWRSTLFFLSRIQSEPPIGSKPKTAHSEQSIASEPDNTQAEQPNCSDPENTQPEQSMRLESAQAYAGEGHLHLAAPDPDVIDAFFLHVVAGKRPTLGHRMLGLVAEAMRFDILLTTNFDELTEQAFKQAGNPLTTFDVHLTSGLPPLGRLLEERSIVKLHGGRYGLRADYSLDASPTEEERRHFASYLVGESIDAATWSSRTPLPPPENHLLVMGFSGQDRRIMDLIESALNRCNHKINGGNGGIKLFWICHTRADEERVLKFCARLNLGCGLAALSGTVDAQPPADRCGSVVLRHRFLGLLFLQLYQHLQRSLPLTGAVHPAISHLAVPPVEVTSWHDEQMQKKVEAEPRCHFHRSFQALCDGFLRGDMAAYRRRFICIYSDRNVTGATSYAAWYFHRELERGTDCIWMDLDDISGTDDLFEQLVDSIARRAGVADWMPVVLHEQWPKRVAELARLTQGQRKWLIFLNAREGGGTNLYSPPRSEAAVGSGGEDLRPNGWLDAEAPPDSPEGCGSKEDETDCAGADRDANGSDFLALINQLCGPACPNVTIVLLCRHPSTKADSKGSEASRTIVPRLQKAGLATQPLEDCFPLIESLDEKNVKTNDKSDPSSNCSAESRQPAHCRANTPKDSKAVCLPEPKDLAESAMAWIRSKDTAARRRFVLALVKTRRARYPAMLWSSAFHGEDTLGISSSADQDSHGPNAVGMGGDACEPGDVPNLPYEKTAAWLRDLREMFVVRITVGGFVWMRRETRDAIRDELANEVRPEASCEERCEERHAVHHGLAEWYHKLFLSSREPLAAFEAIYHYCRAVEMALEALGGTNPGDPELWEGRVSGALSEAVMVLRASRPDALATGHPMTTCRRLTFLRGHSIARIRFALSQYLRGPRYKRVRREVKKQCLKLEVKCLEINRDLAREVSEHLTAYWRHRQIRELLTDKKIEVNRRPPTYRSLSKGVEAGNEEIAKRFNQGGRVSARRFCDWRRNTAKLHMATRAHDSAERWLHSIYRFIARYNSDRTLWPACALPAVCNMPEGREKILREANNPSFA